MTNEKRFEVFGDFDPSKYEDVPHTFATPRSPMPSVTSSHRQDRRRQQRFVTDLVAGHRICDKPLPAHLSGRQAPPPNGHLRDPASCVSAGREVLLKIARLQPSSASIDFPHRLFNEPVGVEFVGPEF
jgi:hypothetical protein